MMLACLLCRVGQTARRCPLGCAPACGMRDTPPPTCRTMQPSTRMLPWLAGTPGFSLLQQLALALHVRSCLSNAGDPLLKMDHALRLAHLHRTQAPAAHSSVPSDAQSKASSCVGRHAQGIGLTHQQLWASCALGKLPGGIRGAAGTVVADRTDPTCVAFHDAGRCRVHWAMWWLVAALVLGLLAFCAQGDLRGASMRSSVVCLALFLGLEYFPQQFLLQVPGSMLRQTC